MIKQQVRVWRDTDLATFKNEILPRNEPAVLQGLLKDWPAVQAGLNSNRALCDYISQIRLIGQEDHLKRYAVEYLCADQAGAAVAFIPLTGNSNPCESLDCATALSRRDVVCELKSN